MRRTDQCYYVIVVFVLLGRPAGRLDSAEHPLSEERRVEIQHRLRDTVDRFTERLQSEPSQIRHYSRRGDAYFFLGRFDKAVSDYETMLELDPALKASHWRLGIAYFYAKDDKKAAAQFEAYHTYDNVDRENGIWRFLSQAKADGFETARAGLLKYKKDDRAPFPAVYRMFAGKMAPEAVLQQIRAAEINDAEREKRLFYAHLYVGLYHDIRDERKPAVTHLRKAVANKWAPGAGFGPRYMWHVARLHYNLRQAGQKPRR